MALELFYWHTPVIVLLRLPHCHTERVRDYASFCHFHSFFDVLAFCSHFLKASGISRLSWIDPCSLFQLFLFVLCCPLLPIHCWGSLYQHLFNVPWAHIPHVVFCLITEDQCVPTRPFYTNVMGFTPHRSCRSSHLLSRLNFLNLPHPRFFLFVQPFSYPNTLSAQY